MAMDFILSRSTAFQLVSLVILSCFILDLDASSSGPSHKVDSSLELLHAVAKLRQAVRTSSLQEAADCSGEPGGCFGTHRAIHQLLPLIIFGFIGAGFYWSYLRFVYPQGRAKKAVAEQPRTVVFAPSQKIYDTFGQENAPNLV
ncbi:hypothetical protein GUITHDRAFT_142128 [Guillardia theta CCMP2712]|uniref:Uncharacterized protein n=1 Tax=Guillardia theta (strain CCMP2712) TaxID=905079 RepID=L1IY44_GUITC|nr:hypothetical protein GUITHDRAFT_142128 [Guillardia theta CCMP2712]EKX41198.1 hypothetical protein GUITHDRAFT_142128 [Guillardia theta CCMP2712]|eukprot:XP_005828178.1 hypothetical protein GUITHDRAFT_142128 [Guillardia theta CCMP2712]